jgi:hypothetical protein
MNWKLIAIGAIMLGYWQRKKVQEGIDYMDMGENVNLSAHFAWHEFARGTGLDIRSANTRTIQMATELANTLELIRAYIGNRAITINSAIRTPAKQAEIEAAGSNPSPTSDHYYAENPASPLSVGAADIVASGMTAIDLFNKILEMKYDGMIQTGQVLLEKHNTWWVHIANPPSKFLNASQLSQRSDSSKNLVAYSLDNGRTFTALPKGGFYKG